MRISVLAGEYEYFAIGSIHHGFRFIHDINLTFNPYIAWVILRPVHMLYVIA